MKNKMTAIVGLLIAGFILAGTVSAIGLTSATPAATVSHEMKGEMGMKGPFHFMVSDEIRTQLDQAIANNDYEAFTSVQAENFPNAPVMTKEQFAQIVNQYQHHQAIQAAIDAGNYDEWKTLVSADNDPRSHALLSKITADNFYKLKELNDLENQQKEIMDKMHTINAELGIQGPMFGMGFGGEMHGHKMKVIRYEDKAAETA